MPIKVERTLFKIGEGGFAVTLPKAWIRYYNLEPGDRVEIIAARNLTIRVKAKSIEAKNTNGLQPSEPYSGRQTVSKH